MVNGKLVNIVMPVKDAVDVAEKAIRCLCGWEMPFMVWNDRSTEENTARLHVLQEELGFTLIDVAELTDHPSPNYLMLLQRAQAECLATDRDLVIVESDVLVQADTLQRMLSAANTASCGMVAAVTHDTERKINFPYLYAQKYNKSLVVSRWSLVQSQKSKEIIDTDKRLSFCCTLLTNAFLRAFDFAQLDPTKDWFDVTISKMSRKLGFKNLLLLDAPVTHMPHASRPWKKLKYTNPLKYYWLKLTHGRDKI